FRPSVVKAICKEVVDGFLKEREWKGDEETVWTRTLADEIRTRVKGEGNLAQSPPVDRAGLSLRGPGPSVRAPAALLSPPPSPAPPLILALARLRPRSQRWGSHGTSSWSRSAWGRCAGRACASPPAACGIRTRTTTPATRSAATRCGAPSWSLGSTRS
ncbi:unnamed protein product, partial [Symbiodinium sp. KB8]